MRTDRHNHRPIAGDTPEVEAIKVLARAHQNLIWSRNRNTNTLRSALREDHPGALGRSTLWPTGMPWPSWVVLPTERGRSAERLEDSVGTQSRRAPT